MATAAAAIAAAKEPGDIVDTAIALSVASLPRALEFYRDLLGVAVRETRRASASELRVNGLTTGRLTQAVMSIPGANVTLVLSEFALPAGGPQVSTPITWRIQDVGSPQLQLEVSRLDSLIERTMRAGYRFLSVGAKPIPRPFGRFVFAIDADGILVEFVEPR